jgi:O-antigen ligase
MNMKALSSTYLNSNRLEEAAWFLVWFTLPLSLKMNGGAIILAACIILFSYARRPFVPRKSKILYLLPPVMFFLWHASELLYDHPVREVWKETEQMLSFLLIPALFGLSRIRKEAFTKSALTALYAALLVAGLVMLAASATRFAHSGDWHEFTYHQLAKPFGMGAIYMSFFLLFALFTMGNKGAPIANRRMTIALALFFLLLLLLCASKLMVGLGLPLLAWQHRDLIALNRRNRRPWIVALLLFLTAGAIPFLQRVLPLTYQNPAIVNADNFREAPEPNGLTLRLVLWRFGLEILEEQQAWLTGVGMYHAQPLLNDKIAGHGLYTGTGRGTDTGYLNYNFHNQYIETIVRTGLPGLVILIGILAIFAMQPRERLFAPKEFIWIVTAFFLTESALERQAGIVFCCLFLFSYYNDDNQVVNMNAHHE